MALPGWDLLLHPGVILSGLGAQIAGAVYSNCLKKMRVRSVAFVNKSADFFIPLAVFLVTHKISISQYLFAGLTTMAFLPLGVAALRAKDFSFSWSFILIICLLFQAVINHLFHVPQLAQNWSDFCHLMTAILFWRAIFILIPLSLQTPLEAPPIKILPLLIGRGFIACLSQASFFFAITRSSSALVWPIINAGPLISCYVAHLYLKEKTGTIERNSAFQYGAVVLLYIIMEVR